MPVPRGYVFFKSAEMEEIDEKFGDVWYNMTGGLRFLETSWRQILTSTEDKEIEIVHQLSLNILQHEAVLAEVSDLCGDLDW